MSGFFTKVSMFFYKIQDTISSAFSVLIIAACIIGIIFVILIAATKLKKRANLAIVFSTILSCLIMIPLMTAFNSLVTKRAVSEVTDSQFAEIEKRKTEIKLLAAEQEVKEKEKEILDNKVKMQKQSIEMTLLEDSVRSLKNTQLSIQDFKEILEIGLLETNLKQTNLYRKKLDEIKKGMGWIAEQYYDEGLVVLTHDIIAKFGVDLKKIKITVSNDFPNILFVSGITPEFLGTSKNKHKKEVAEIRRVDIKNNIKTYTVLNEQSAVKKANEYADACEEEYQTRLSKGLETDFMNEAVTKLAKKFISLFLHPLKKEIKFDAIKGDKTFSMEEYFEEELKLITEKRERLGNDNENLDSETQAKEEELQKLKTKL